MRLFSKNIKKIILHNIPITAVIQIDKKFVELSYCSDTDYKFENSSFARYVGPSDKKYDVLLLWIYSNKMLKDSRVKELLFEYMI